MAVPAKSLFAAGTAFVVGVGLTVALVPSTSKTFPEPPASSRVVSDDTAKDAPAKPVAAAATPVRAWVDPVKPTPPQVASAPVVSTVPAKPVEIAEASSPTPVDAAPAETVVTPKKRTVAYKVPSRAVAAAKQARIRAARARAPREEYAQSGFYDEAPIQAEMAPASPYDRRAPVTYDSRYRQASMPYRGAVYADASVPYADERVAVRPAPQGGVMRWLMEPGTR